MTIERTVFISCGFPVIALSFCLVQPLATDFEAVTRTHCQTIRNFLPSVSAAIGHNAQTVFLWFFLIILHVPSRFKLAKQLNQAYNSLLAQIYTSDFVVDLKTHEMEKFRRLKYFIQSCYILNKCEIIGLVILTLFTSNTNYGNFFFIFQNSFCLN